MVCLNMYEFQWTIHFSSFRFLKNARSRFWCFQGRGFYVASTYTLTLWGPSTERVIRSAIVFSDKMLIYDIIFRAPNKSGKRGVCGWPRREICWKRKESADGHRTPPTPRENRWNSFYKRMMERTQIKMDRKLSKKGKFYIKYCKIWTNYTQSLS